VTGNTQNNSKPPIGALNKSTVLVIFITFQQLGFRINIDETLSHGSYSTSSRHHNLSGPHPSLSLSIFLSDISLSVIDNVRMGVKPLKSSLYTLYRINTCTNTSVSVGIYDQLIMYTGWQQ
jgi:hypothetical protein